MNIQESDDFGLHLLFQEEIAPTDALLTTAQVGNTDSIPLTCTIPLDSTSLETRAEMLAAICSYSTLNQEQKQALLGSQNEKGESALHLATLNGHTECALDMIDLIVSSSISQEEKISQLVAKNSHGLPALHYAAVRGDDVLMSRFLAAFERLSMSKEEKIALLTLSDDPHSKSPLACAAEHGHDKCLALLITAIEKLPISDLEKMRCFENKHSLTNSAFYCAAYKGQISCMQQLLKAIDKLKLPVKEKIKCFVDKEDNKDYFHASVLRQIRKTQSIPVIVQAIDNLAISDQEKISLLMSKDYYGASVLHSELCSPIHSKFAKDYLNALMRMKVADTEKLAVFKATYFNNSATAMHIAAQKGRTDCLEALINAIENMNISSQEKIALLEASDKYGIAALDIAVKNGNTECVELLTSAICRQQISEEQRAQIAEIKQYYYTSMAFLQHVAPETTKAALQRDYGKSISAIQCFAAIASGFSEAQKAALLATNPKHTETAKSRFGYDDGYSYDDCQASAFFLRYLAYIDNLQVSKEEKQKLLAAKDCFEAPALFWFAHSPAMYYQDLCIEALMDSMVKSTTSDQEMPSLLEARGNYKTCALALVGKSDLADDFYGTLAALNIPSEQKLRLLAAKNSQGSPALFEAIENEHLGSDENKFKDLLDQITSLNIDEAEKVTLLEAKNSQDVPVIHALAEQGYPIQLQHLVDAIVELTISNTEKIRLLEGRNSAGLLALNAAAKFETQEEENKDCGQACIDILLSTIAELQAQTASQPRAGCHYPLF